MAIGPLSVRSMSDADKNERVLESICSKHGVENTSIRQSADSPVCQFVDSSIRKAMHRDDDRVNNILMSQVQNSIPSTSSSTKFEDWSSTFFRHCVVEFQEIVSRSVEMQSSTSFPLMDVEWKSSVMLLNCPVHSQHVSNSLEHLVCVQDSSHCCLAARDCTFVPNRFLSSSFLSFSS